VTEGVTEDGVQREPPGHAPRTIAIFSIVSAFSLGGAVFIVVSSLSGRGDTPCGPLVDPNFG
jgi:hypothetical protein